MPPPAPRGRKGKAAKIDKAELPEAATPAPAAATPAPASVPAPAPSLAQSEAKEVKDADGDVEMTAEPEPEPEEKPKRGRKAAPKAKRAAAPKRKGRGKKAAEPEEESETEQEQAVEKTQADDTVQDVVTKPAAEFKPDASDDTDVVMEPEPAPSPVKRSTRTTRATRAAAAAAVPPETPPQPRGRGKAKAAAAAAAPVQEVHSAVTTPVTTKQAGPSTPSANTRSATRAAQAAKDIAASQIVVKLEPVATPAPAPSAAPIPAEVKAEPPTKVKAEKPLPIALTPGKSAKPAPAGEQQPEKEGQGGRVTRSMRTAKKQTKADPAVPVAASGSGSAAAAVVAAGSVQKLISIFSPSKQNNNSKYTQLLRAATSNAGPVALLFDQPAAQQPATAAATAAKPSGKPAIATSKDQLPEKLPVPAATPAASDKSALDSSSVSAKPHAADNGSHVQPVGVDAKHPQPSSDSLISPSKLMRAASTAQVPAGPEGKSLLVCVS